MTPLTPNMDSHYFLSNVRYLPDKRQMMVEYSNSKEKFNERYSFYPKFYLSLKSVNKEALEKVLSLYDRKRFKLEVKGGLVQITASTFIDLKKLANLTHSSFRVQPVLLGPERQFLIESNRSYFDCFERTRLGFEKRAGLALPDIETEFLSEPLKKTLAQLMEKNDTGTARKILESVAFANLLSIPLKEIPFKKSLLVEAFLEKTFFRHGFACQATGKKEFDYSQEKRLYRCFNNLIEVDFSFVWPTLFTFPYYNIGFDSLQCSCCKPESLNANNLAPNSLVEVEFQSEGAYIFNSNYQAWAKEFHHSQPGKESRSRLKQEWNLDNYPIGPFSAGQQALIPLADLPELLEKEQAKVLNGHQLIWFCQQKESFLSQEINALNSRIQSLGLAIDKTEQSSLSQFNLMSSTKLDKDLQYLYLKTFKSCVSELLTYIPTHLLAVNSKFYSAELSQAIKVMQTQTINAFRKFASEEGSKFIHSNNYATFIESDAALNLARSFSLKQDIPAPAIKARHKLKSFG